MRLTAQIGEYEMDQVILDLGSDTNVLPKKMWERMGRPALQGLLSNYEWRTNKRSCILVAEIVFKYGVDTGSYKNRL